MEFVVAIGLGVVASFAFWLVVTKLIKPSLKVPDRVLIRTDDKQERRLSFEVKNTGRRACFSVSIYAHLRLKRANANPNSFRIFEVCLGKGGAMRLTPYIPGRGRKIYTLCFLDSPEICNSPMLKEVVAQADGDNVRFFEKACEAFPGTHLEVNVIGYDETTGAIGHGRCCGMTSKISGTTVFDPRIHGTQKAQFGGQTLINEEELS